MTATSTPIEMWGFEFRQRSSGSYPLEYRKAGGCRHDWEMVPFDHPLVEAVRAATANPAWRCESCAHFRRPEPDGQGYYWDAPEGVEQEEAPRWGSCAVVVDTNSARGGVRSERAYPQDASSHQAWLMVREDFGCAEFTPSGNGSQRDADQ